MPPTHPQRWVKKRKGSQERVRKNLLLFSSFQEFLPGFFEELTASVNQNL